MKNSPPPNKSCCPVDKENNWLPAPEGPFWPILRTYGPGKSILDKTYKLPAVKQVK